MPGARRSVPGETPSFHWQIDATHAKTPHRAREFGGLSGPAIKPLAPAGSCSKLPRRVKIPIIGLGGIATGEGRGRNHGWLARARCRWGNRLISGEPAARGRASSAKYGGFPQLAANRRPSNALVGTLHL